MAEHILAFGVFNFRNALNSPISNPASAALSVLPARPGTVGVATPPDSFLCIACLLSTSNCIAPLLQLPAFAWRCEIQYKSHPLVDDRPSRKKYCPALDR